MRLIHEKKKANLCRKNRASETFTTDNNLEPARDVTSLNANFTNTNFPLRKQCIPRNKVETSVATYLRHVLQTPPNSMHPTNSSRWTGYSITQRNFFQLIF